MLYELHKNLKYLSTSTFCNNPLKCLGVADSIISPRLCILLPYTSAGSYLCAVQQRHQTVGGGRREDMTAGDQASWTQDMRGSSPSLLPLKCTFCSPFPELGPFQGCSLERIVCCWDHLDGINDWTQWRPLYKLLRFSRGRWEAAVGVWL